MAIYRSWRLLDTVPRLELFGGWDTGGMSLVLVSSTVRACMKSMFVQQVGRRPCLHSVCECLKQRQKTKDDFASSPPRKVRTKSSKLDLTLIGWVRILILCKGESRRGDGETECAARCRRVAGGRFTSSRPGPRTLSRQDLGYDTGNPSVGRLPRT